MCLFEEAFSAFDKDGDGVLGVDEIQSVMRYLGHDPTAKEVLQIFEQIDADGSGDIDFEELSND